MTIFMQTTYYHPHTSGLTLYFKKIAEEYVKNGHSVKVLTLKHKSGLPTREKICGVEVIRSPILFKLNKGMLAPQLLFYALPLIRGADAIHLNLPSIESLPVAVLGKLLRKRIVSTYVCDLILPSFLVGAILGHIIDLIHFAVLFLSSEITTLTRDFAKNSRVLKYFLHRVTPIYPIIEVGSQSSVISEMKKTQKKNSGPFVGMLTRIASEKGIHIVLDILPNLRAKFPGLILFIAGETHAVGEEEYWNKISRSLERNKESVCILGQLSDKQVTYFYKNIDLLVVASTNSTEAFGLVQIEAMLHGVPVVATELPGVRIPISETGMGLLAKVNNPKDLFDKIIKVLLNRSDYKGNIPLIKNRFSAEKIIYQYLELLAGEKK